MILIFLTSGLFLGWSLGANDAANIFGTAVGTRMLRFKTAAIIAGIFVVLGSVFGGTGASHTLGKLGSVNALAGSFTVALGAAFTVFFMTKLKLPVSTSQAIVGAIIGWNIYSHRVTDLNIFSKIFSTWILCPILAALFSIVLYKITNVILSRIKLHLLRQDNYTRIGLMIIGAFGAYSLGANNIANVMGVFVGSIPFEPINFMGLFTLTGAQQLFFLGGLSIAIGIYTYSHKVMDTVGAGLMKLSPVTALIVVLSQSLVLFLFSSVKLENILINLNLPTIPLVPVSSSQAIIGAILGIGIAKGGKGIRFNVLKGISSGWIITPIIACAISLTSLFFVQNVFSQQVNKKLKFMISQEVIEYLNSQNIQSDSLESLKDKFYETEYSIYNAIQKTTKFERKNIIKIVKAAQITILKIDPTIINKKLSLNWFSNEQIQAVKNLSGQNYNYKWKLHIQLQNQTREWRLKKDSKKNKIYNRNINQQLEHLYQIFLYDNQ